MIRLSRSHSTPSRLLAALAGALVVAVVSTVAAFAVEGAHAASTARGNCQRTVRTTTIEQGLAAVQVGEHVQPACTWSAVQVRPSGPLVVSLDTRAAAVLTPRLHATPRPSHSQCTWQTLASREVTSSDGYNSEVAAIIVYAGQTGASCGQMADAGMFCPLDHGCANWTYWGPTYPYHIVGWWDYPNGEYLNWSGTSTWIGIWLVSNAYGYTGRPCVDEYIHLETYANLSDSLENVCLPESST